MAAIKPKRARQNHQARAIALKQRRQSALFCDAVSGVKGTWTSHCWLLMEIPSRIARSTGCRNRFGGLAIVEAARSWALPTSYCVCWKLSSLVPFSSDRIRSTRQTTGNVFSRPTKAVGFSTRSCSSSCRCCLRLSPRAASRTQRPQVTRRTTFSPQPSPRRNSRRGIVLVASGDRDTFQLASDAATILHPVRAGEMARIGPAEVLERF
jgi:hypothetical protein